MRTNRERRLAAAMHRWRLMLPMIGVLVLGTMLVPGSISARGQAAPTSTAAPQVLGTPVVGNTVTAANGSWSGSSPLQFTYRWFSCPASGGASDGSDCKVIYHTNPRNTFYRVRAADRGSSLRVRVTAKNGEGLAHVLSNASGTIQIAGRLPVSLSVPRITGKPIVGATLTAKRGLTAGARPIAFRYAWQRCNTTGGGCDPILGATGQTFSPTNAEAGSKLRVRVIASNSAGATWSASVLTAVVSPQATAAAPHATGEPRILGTPVVGNTLTSTNGSWSGSTPMSFMYQWRRCPKNGGAADASNCGVIPNAGGSTYRVRSADVGLRLRVRVTARNADGSDTSASNPTDIVQRASSKPVNTSPPTISGTTTVGQTLTANNGSWSGTQPLSFAYQWRRCDQNGGSCSSIGGAAGKTYGLKGVDAQNTLRVSVTAKNSAGETTSTSAPSAVVHEAPPPGPGGVINLPGGLRSIPVASVPKGERLIMSIVHFSPRVVRTRSQPITIQVRVFDTRGYVVRGALVFARSTPRVTSGETRQTATDGWVMLQLQPLGTFPLQRGAVQFFLRAYRAGDPLLAGISSRRLVQVIVRPS